MPTEAGATDTERAAEGVRRRTAIQKAQAMSDARANRKAKAKRDLARIARGGPLETREMTNYAAEYDLKSDEELAELVASGSQIERKRAASAIGRRLTALLRRA